MHLDILAAEHPVEAHIMRRRLPGYRPAQHPVPDQTIEKRVGGQRPVAGSTVRAQDFAFFEGFALAELLRATARRTSAWNADSSTSSPSWMSIARRTFPSRLELKRRAGSFRDAPLAKVSFTTFL